MEFPEKRDRGFLLDFSLDIKCSNTRLMDFFKSKDLILPEKERRHFQKIGLF
jgi:hypothetical protein